MLSEAAAESAPSKPSSPSSDANTIKIFARIRPSKHGSTAGARRYSLDQAEPSVQNTPQLHFHISKDETQGLINNSRENYDFRFHRVFDQITKQEEVFDIIAKPVVDNVLEGYNGTIFAYGQTGSGKTFTITGGAEKYDDRGLIPRCVEFMFEKMRQDTSREYSMMVSYMEIYNENGYDLLQNNRDNVPLEQLPKVQLQEDDERIVLRNLSQHEARDEEEALNLLFFGDTNKMIAETPSNPASSRSHCIFQITVTSKEHDTAKIRRSKLNLVDLAGSERVSRTKIDGTILKEARYINLSLHYLEQVIIALHEKSIGLRTHIPYRNSMMTSILRDSLGGNCKTSMIATVAVEQELINESISTCRFAQRVALIRNDAHVNEEMDLNIVIENLKKEIEMLRAELALLRGDGPDSSVPLPEYEIERLKITVDNYLADSSNQDLVFEDIRKITHAFRIMKGYIVEQRSGNSAQMVAYSEDPPNVRSLKEQIIQRDAEIGILVSMIGDKSNEKESHLDSQSSLDIQRIRNEYGSLLNRYNNRESEINDADNNEQISHNDTSFDTKNKETAQESNIQSQEANEEDIPKVLTKNDRLDAFKEFQTYNPQLQSEMQNQKKEYKQKHEQAKELGAKTQELKSRLAAIKSELEAKQMEKILCISDTTQSSDISSLDLKIADLKEDLAITKKSYRDSVTILKQLKHECEHLQRLINASKTRMLHDFENWLTQVKFKGYVLHQVNEDVSRSESRVDSHERSKDIPEEMIPPPIVLPPKVKKAHSSRSSSRLSVKAVVPIETKQLTKTIADPRVQQDILAFYRASNNSRNSNK